MASQSTDKPRKKTRAERWAEYERQREEGWREGAREQAAIITLGVFTREKILRGEMECPIPGLLLV